MSGQNNPIYQTVLDADLANGVNTNVLLEKFEESLVTQRLKWTLSKIGLDDDWVPWSNLINVDQHIWNTYVTRFDKQKLGDYYHHKLKVLSMENGCNEQPRAAWLGFKPKMGCIL